MTGAESQLVKRLTGLVQPDVGCWRGLSEAVAVAVPERHRALQTIIERSTP